MGRKSNYDFELTSRERQVLELIKLGYSNRGIADRLGISHAGVKYHVSQILSKLGVDNREEAAAWNPSHSKRWAIMPGLAYDRLGAVLLTGGLGTKKVAVLGSAALVGLMLILFSSSVPAARGGPTTAAPPSPTPDLRGQCAPPDCFRAIHQEVASLDEARMLTSFEPKLPQKIPLGFEPLSLVYTHPESGLAGPEAPFEWLVAHYSDNQGRHFLVAQGYLIPPTRYYDLAPVEMRGHMVLGSQNVYWIRGAPEVDNGRHAQGWQDGAMLLFTEGEQSGSLVLQRSPDGTEEVRRSGTPFTIQVSSVHLDASDLAIVLESLLK